VSVGTLNYRPILSSERAPNRKNIKTIVTKERIRIKSGHGPQKGSPIPGRTGRLTVGRNINSTQLRRELKRGRRYRLTTSPPSMS
jgi:hypothetical protein